MSGPATGSERMRRLGDRLAAAGRELFVGRETELALFREAVQADRTGYAVLHVYGPGGVGKTALLAEYERLAAEQGATAVRLDGRDVEPSPSGFLDALRAALGLPEGAAPLEALAGRSRAVLLLDTYEALSVLDGWLREQLLPELPAASVVVIAGQQRPVPAWRTDPGWSRLARLVPLRNLPPEESRAYLRARGISEDRHPTALAFTHGHPFALALVADLLARVDLDDLRPERVPDVVRELLERFVRHVPSAAHRRALEVCARARVTTEALLADVLDDADAAELFGWLRGLSFVQQGVEGLFPHDLAREVLDADLRWRDPESFRSLHGRVLRFLVRRLQSRVGREQQRAYFDVIYLSRNDPLMLPFYDWQSMGATYAEPAGPDDGPEIVAMVRHHEGDASARIAGYWLGRQPEAFLAIRDATRGLVGFTAALLLDERCAEDCAADPAVAAAWRFVDLHGPLRAGERIMHHRFMMSRDGYQDLATITLVAGVGSVRWLTTPGLAWSFPTVANFEARDRHFAAVGFARAPEADFEVGGRRYGVFAHDWWVEPPLAWIERKGQLDLAVGQTREAPGLLGREALLVLSREDFASAVRQGLRDFGRAPALASNPLMRSRVVAEQAGGAPTPATLQALLREAAETLRATPRDEKLYRAVRRTYLEPAATQELAAEVLGVPFSTYRRHLTTGVARVTAWLWRRELDGPDG